MLKYEMYGEEFDIGFSIDEYCTNDNLAVVMYCKDADGLVETFGYMTVNIDYLPQPMACLDTNNIVGIEKWVTDNNLGTDTGRRIVSGFCEYPVYILNLEAIKRHLMFSEVTK